MTISAKAILDLTQGYLLEQLQEVGVSDKEKVLAQYTTATRVTNKTELLKQLIGSASNRQMGKNVIGKKIENQQQNFEALLFDFDPAKIEAHWGSAGDEALLAELQRSKIAPPTRSGAKRSGYWAGFCKSIIDAAHCVNSIDLEQFNDIAAKQFAILGAIYFIEASIRGFGPALAADALKEAGLVNTVKPDVHIIKLAEILGWKWTKDVELLIRMNKFCGESGVSPFEFDKVVWLVLSDEKFYKIFGEPISEEQRKELRRSIDPREWKKRLRQRMSLQADLGSSELPLQHASGGPVTNAFLDELNELALLRTKGVLSEADFERRKSNLMSEAIESFDDDDPGPKSLKS
jgi:hypothetical protein